MSKKVIIAILATITGLVTVIGIIFMVLGLTGSISLLKNSITITSESYQKEYDGESLDPSRYEVNGKLYDGDKVSLEFYEISSNVGTYTTYFEAKVLNKNGKDVSESYNINKNYGTLTITKRELTIAVVSETELYDGTELKATDYEIEEGSLAQGEELDVTFSGAITEIGEAKASLIYAIYKTIDGNKINVSKNYKVTTVEGILTKEALPLTIKSDSAEMVYDGCTHTVNTYTTPLLKINDEDTDDSHTEYLVSGDYISYTAKTEVYSVGTYSNDFDVVILDSDGNDVTKNYAITKQYGDITVKVKDLIITSGSFEKEYDGITYVAANDASYTTDGLIADNDSLDLNFITSATSAGTYDNIVYATVKNQSGENVSNNYNISIYYGKITINPKAVLFTTSSYQKEYDGTVLENQGDAELSSQTPLLTGDTYTATFVNSIKDAGEVSNLATIIIKNSDDKDVTQNYNISLVLGKLTITPREITLRASSYTKAYDGLPISSSEWNLISGSTATGEYLSVFTKAEEELVEAGTTKNIITYQIVNENGAILSNAANNYNVTLIDGFLEIYNTEKTPLYLAPMDLHAEYVDDTTVLSPSGIVGFDYYASLGYTISYVLSGSQMGIGTSASQIVEGSVKIKNATDQDVTESFNLHLEAGILQIYQKEIIIETASIDVDYDGTKHSDSTLTITGNEGLVLDYTVTGERTTVGTSMNTISVTGVYRATDTEKENNLIGQYYVHIILGTIKINQKAITVTTASKTASIQDESQIGAPLMDGDIPGLVSGHTFVQSTVTLSEVGTKQNAITIIIQDADGNNVTSNYSITYIYGTLTLTD